MMSLLSTAWWIFLRNVLVILLNVIAVCYTWSSKWRPKCHMSSWLVFLLDLSSVTSAPLLGSRSVKITPQHAGVAIGAVHLPSEAVTQFVLS